MSNPADSKTYTKTELLKLMKVAFQPNKTNYQDLTNLKEDEKKEIEEFHKKITLITQLKALFASFEYSLITSGIISSFFFGFTDLYLFIIGFLEFKYANV